MPTYKAPVDDVLFLLNDVFHHRALRQSARLRRRHRPTLSRRFCGEAAKFCEEVLQPLNRVGDKEGCTRNADGSVTTPKGFKEAYKQIVEGGWIGISAPAEFGGQGLPATLTDDRQRIHLLRQHGLRDVSGPDAGRDRGAARARHRRAERRHICRRWSTGAWTGTMNLTEPHCGTDLGLLRTKAVKQPDGSYKITGTKIFISAGEHDLAENIIHLVLARIEGAPDGIKGISLFVVPKFLVNADGSLGARNGVSLRLDRSRRWAFTAIRPA